MDALPQVLRDLAERWEIELGSLIRRGSVSVVIRCRTADGRSAVLKVSPDQGRIRDEAAALVRWTTAHVPVVYAVDEGVGALLIEAIEPGTPLVESPEYPSTASLASLMRSLHADGLPDPAFRPVAELSPELYERSRNPALRLGAGPSASVLLHGDLTPVNILDGGEARGLVAIDPAPCIGDPAFDAIDLVLWRADDAETVVRRIDELAHLLGWGRGRLLDWCSAFAGMVAMEAAEASSGSSAQLQALLALASRV